MRCVWPVANATRALPIAANDISQPVAVSGSTFICHLRESTEPTAQLIEENRSVQEPTSCMVPRALRSANLGQKRMAMPAIPSASPIKPRRESRSPRKTKVSSTINQIGVTATISAASPVGTHCSAQARPPLAATSSRHPIVASRIASFKVMRTVRPMAAHAASISGPAIRNRRAHITAGGRCSSSAIPIAR